MILISCSMDSQSQYVNIDDDDNDLKILESVAPLTLLMKNGS